MLIEQLVRGPRVKGLIVDPRGWWIGDCFCTRHGLMKKLKKEEENKGLVKKV